MKKSKLIKQLNAMRGDPDILVWNAHLSDYVDIENKLTHSYLVRMTFEWYCKSLEYDRVVEKQDTDYRIPESELPELQKAYDEQTGWGVNELITYRDVTARKYHRKYVLFMKTKGRGLKATHRFSMD
jgi:hypothetical protein